MLCDRKMCYPELGRIGAGQAGGLTIPRAEALRAGTTTVAAPLRPPLRVVLLCVRKVCYPEAGMLCDDQRRHFESWMKACPGLRQSTAEAGVTGATPQSHPPQVISITISSSCTLPSLLLSPVLLFLDFLFFFLCGGCGSAVCAASEPATAPSPAVSIFLCRLSSPPTQASALTSLSDSAILFLAPDTICCCLAPPSDTLLASLPLRSSAPAAIILSAEALSLTVRLVNEERCIM